MIKAYGYSVSGNCYKVRLLLEQMERNYEWCEIDSSRGETRTPAFLAKNANGRVPIIELDDGRILAESNAILCYLADCTQYFPVDAWQRAQALSWMFFEQYSHEPYIAVARFIRGWTPIDSPRRRAELPRCMERGHQALAVMERYLQSRRWFTGEQYGIADIALFAYTDVAAQGGFDLDAYAAIREWLSRIKQTAGFMAMPELAPENLALLAYQD